MGDTDSDLLARVAKGDNLALKTFYGRHHVKVFRFALRILKSEAAAEDVVSEVFLDVWRQAASFEGRAEVSTFLLAVARNKAYSQLRKRRDDQLDEEQAGEIEDLSDTPETTLQKKSKGEVLRACLQKLSAEHREVMDLVYYHDKSVEEVAAIVGVPEGTVKTRMFHARKRLANLARAAGLDRGWP